jgi:hypothetical protein
MKAGFRPAGPVAIYQPVYQLPVDFLQSLSPEQADALLQQHQQVQVTEKLATLADFFDERAAYQAQGAALAEQQWVQQEAEGRQVFASMLEQARRESKTSAPVEDLDEWTRGWLDVQAEQLRGQGYDAETIQAHVFTPEHIGATVREVAKESAAAELRENLLRGLK